MVSIAHLESLRRDLVSYALGVLWLLAIAVLNFSSEDIHEFAKFMNALAMETADVKVPEFAIGFLLIVFGVLLPYCIEKVVEPLVVAILNMYLWVNRRLSRSTNIETLDDPAGDAMKECLGHDVSIARDRCEVFLEGHFPRLVHPLTRNRLSNDFRAQALLPACILIASFIAHLTSLHIMPPWPIVIGSLVGVLVFVFGIHAVIDELREGLRSFNVAVLIAAKAAERQGEPRTS